MTNAPQRSSGPFMTSTVVCPTHGLRFDPSQSSGCIRCRAESAPPPREPTTRRALLIGAASVAALGAAAYAYTQWPFGGASARGSAALEPRRLQTKNPAGRSGSYFLPEAPVGSPLPLLVFLHGTQRSGKDGSRSALRTRCSLPTEPRPGRWAIALATSPTTAAT